MPKWTHVQRNRSAAPDVSWGLGLGGEQSKSPGTRASVLKDKAAEPAGSPAQVQQVCRFWKSEGANIYCTTSFCKSLGLSWKPARTWLLSWETCWTSVERRSWAPQVPVAAKTRGKWAVSPLNIGILQKFSWWNMISNMVKWWIHKTVFLSLNWFSHKSQHFCWFCDSTAIFDEFAASFSWYD